MSEYRNECIPMLLDFPRPSGSKAEERARHIIRKKIASAGYSSTEDPFKFSPDLVTNGMKTVLGIQAILVFLAMLFPKHPVTWLFLAIMLSGLFIGLFTDWFMRLSGSIQTSSQMTSANIVVPPRKGNEPVIIFSAHADSKTSAMNAVSRTIWLVLLVFMSTASIFISALSSEMTGKYIAAATLVLHLPILLKNAGKESHGGLDNASGVAAVIAVAEKTQKNPPTGFRPAFLVTGAEEAGLCGAWHMARNLPSWCNPDRDAIINFDVVGASEKHHVIERVGLFKGSSTGLLASAIEFSGIDLDARLSTLAPGAGVDHLPFRSLGMASATIMNIDLKKAMVHIHTRRDTPDRVNMALVDRCAEMALAGATRWASFTRNERAASKAHVS